MQMQPDSVHNNGRDCLLPVELMVESWQTVDWEVVQSREDLIHARMEQLDQRRVSRCDELMQLSEGEQNPFR